MSKKLVIILINIFLLVGIYFAGNYFVNKYTDYGIDTEYLMLDRGKDDSDIDIEKYAVEERPEDFKYIELNEDSFKQFCGEDRIEFGENYVAKPIVVMGCSYAYGHGLKRENSFPYVLSQITQRPVYNFARCGSDAWDSFVQLQGFFNFP